MRWAVTLPATSIRPWGTLADDEIQAIGENVFIAYAEYHKVVIAGPVTVKIIADRIGGDHVLHAEADVITRRMPARGRT